MIFKMKKISSRKGQGSYVFYAIAVLIIALLAMAAMILLLKKSPVF